MRRRHFFGGLAALPVTGCASQIQSLSVPSSSPALQNATGWIREQLAKAGRGAVVRLNGGEYHFHADKALKRHLYISNNDPAENAIVFPVVAKDGLVIDGDGARLIFHGLVTPFALIGSRDITVRNLTIDWAVPFHVEGDILTVSSDGRTVELNIPAEFSYRVSADGKFFFRGEGFEQEGIKNLLAFDRERRESVFQVRDEFVKWRDGSYRNNCKAEDLGERRLRLTLTKPFQSRPEAGQRLLIMPPKRLAPAVFIADCARIKLENVIIRHSGCMGLIAQMSRDIALTRCTVAPDPAANRYVSTTVDATHFVNCSGMIAIDGCTFSNHIDDAVNVHGIYQRVLALQPDGKVLAERADHQQRGVETVRVGDEITLADAREVNVYHRSKVHAAEYPDDRRVLLTLDTPPRSVREGDVVNTVSRQAGVSLTNSSVARNRARGVLISTEGAVTIRGNRFHTPGSAIRISGGVDHWYESGPTRSVLITENIFDNCKYGIWGKAVLDVECVDATDRTATKPFHGVVQIVNNKFISLGSPLVNAYRAERIAFTDNAIHRGSVYPIAESERAPIIAQAVQNIDVRDNTVTGFEFRSWVDR